MTQSNGSSDGASNGTTNGHSSDAPKVIPLWIDGREETLSSTFPVQNPTTNKKLYDCSSASVEDAKRVVQIAQKAAKSWAKTKPDERRDIFLKAAKLWEEHGNEYSAYMEEETGALETWSRGINVNISAAMLKDIAGRISSIEHRAPITNVGDRSSIVYKEPYGVVLGIAPWNAPFILGFRACAYALATGNAVILKGSELSPRCFWAIGKVFHDAGIPAGVLNVLLYRPEDAASVTTALVTNPAIKKVNFTGSTAIGGIIAEQCGKHLKPCLMELGGKNSTIVLEDADLEFAAKQCALGSLVHSGQVCMSTDRIIVQRSIISKFKDLLFSAIKEVFPEDGPAPVLVTAAGVKKTKTIVNDTISAGGKVIYGAQDTSEESTTRMRPIVIDGIKKGMPLYSDEAFGPAMGIIEIDHWEEAVEIMNDTDYGLSAAVFTKDLRKALQISREVESGAIHINTMTVHDESALPHGGVGQSGWGRFNNKDGLEEFLKTKTVTWDN